MMTFSLLRQMPRCFSTSTACNSRLATSIPGLHIYHDFLRVDQKSELQTKAIHLHQAILSHSSNSTSHGCRTYLSQYHNLKSAEHYLLVGVNDESGVKISGQHFERYGEDGHKLTYFIGNGNLPRFIKDGLITRVLKIPAVMAMIQGKSLNWNLTFNTYATAKNRSLKMAGFDFHKDIESNGEVSLIYSIGAKSEFQIRHPKNSAEVQTFPLLSNSLVLLSNEARWDYEHRVIPVTVNDSISLLENEVETIRRISLVLGFKLCRG